MQTGTIPANATVIVTLVPCPFCNRMPMFNFYLECHLSGMPEGGSSDRSIPQLNIERKIKFCLRANRRWLHNLYLAFQTVWDSTVVLRPRPFAFYELQSIQIKDIRRLQWLHFMELGQASWAKEVDLSLLVYQISGHLFIIVEAQRFVLPKVNNSSLVSLFWTTHTL